MTEPPYIMWYIDTASGSRWLNPIILCYISILHQGRDDLTPLYYVIYRYCIRVEMTEPPYIMLYIDTASGSRWLNPLILCYISILHQGRDDWTPLYYVIYRYCIRVEMTEPPYIMLYIDTASGSRWLNPLILCYISILHQGRDDWTPLYYVIYRYCIRVEMTEPPYIMLYIDTASGSRWLNPLILCYISILHQGRDDLTPLYYVIYRYCIRVEMTEPPYIMLYIDTASGSRWLNPLILCYISILHQGRDDWTPLYYVIYRYCIRVEMTEPPYIMLYIDTASGSRWLNPLILCYISILHQGRDDWTPLYYVIYRYCIRVEMTEPPYIMLYIDTASGSRWLNPLILCYISILHQGRDDWTPLYYVIYRYCIRVEMTEPPYIMLYIDTASGSRWLNPLILCYISILHQGRDDWTPLYYVIYRYCIRVEMTEPPYIMLYIDTASGSRWLNPLILCYISILHQGRDDLTLLYYVIYRYCIRVEMTEPPYIMLYIDTASGSRWLNPLILCYISILHQGRDDWTPLYYVIYRYCIRVEMT